MQLLKALFFILFTALPLHATHTLLPPSAMHPIEPANLNWHLKVYTPPDEYEIHLTPGYTISKHFETIGKDLSHRIRRRWEDPEDVDFVHFLIYLPEKENLGLVRRDPGVELVIESAEYQAISDPTVEEDYHGKHVEL